MTGGIRSRELDLQLLPRSSDGEGGGWSTRPRAAEDGEGLLRGSSRQVRLPSDLGVARVRGPPEPSTWLDPVRAVGRFEQ